MANRINKAFRFIKNKIRLSFKEKRLGKLKYIYERNGSDELIIMFSGFGTVRKYNYMNTLAQSKIDKLFILDSFGYRGSYYWYEKGKNTPIVLVTKLIQRVVDGGGIKRYIQPVVAKAELAPSIMALNSM